MLDYLWAYLFIISILLIPIIAYIEYKEYPFYWPIILSLGNAINFWFLSGSVFEWETAYEYVNNTGVLQEGIHTYTSKVSPQLSLLCNLFGTIIFIYFIYLISMVFRELYNKRTGRLRHGDEEK